jgi:hypothetical protein
MPILGNMIVSGTSLVLYLPVLLLIIKTQVQEQTAIGAWRKVHGYRHEQVPFRYLLRAISGNPNSTLTPFKISTPSLCSELRFISAFNRNWVNTFLLQPHAESSKPY